MFKRLFSETWGMQKKKKCTLGFLGELGRPIAVGGLLESMVQVHLYNIRPLKGKKISFLKEMTPLQQWRTAENVTPVPESSDASVPLLSFQL